MFGSLNLYCISSQIFNIETVSYKQSDSKIEIVSYKQTDVKH